MKKPLPKKGLEFLSARRPYLPGSHPPSTSGAVELDFRVRDGNGYFLYAMATRKLCVFSAFKAKTL